MWTHSVRFPVPKTTVDEEDGFETTVENWSEEIPADFTDTTRNDEMSARQLGFDTDQNIKVHISSYNGQGYLKDEATGEVYDVKRTFSADKSMYIILQCKKRERGKAVHYGEVPDYGL